MRKIIFILIFTVMCSFQSFNAKALDSPPTISANGVVLMDATTGQILYSKNMNTQYPPASTTKIMTALLALENCKLDDIVTVGKNPPNIDGSKVGLIHKEKLPMKDLLYALLLQSANDSALTIAEHISGSGNEFAKLMNKRATELGCTHTNFVNPHGLYDANHRTTANDLAIILRELSKHPEFKEIATTSVFKSEPTNKYNKVREIWNKDKLILKNSKYYYKGCEGGKTGYTIQSKHSFVATACRNNQKLIAVLLHDSKHTYWSDVRNLFDYGFNNFSLKTFYTKGNAVSEYSINSNTKIPLLASKNFCYVVEKNSTKKPELEIISKDLNNSSFNKGDKILKANVIYDNREIGTLDLESGENHNTRLPMLSAFKNNLNTSNKVIYLYLSIIILLIIILLILLLKSRKHKH